MHLERRARISRPLQWAAPLLAVGFTLLVAALLVAGGRRTGRPGLCELLQGGFGSRFAWTETLTRATPLILTGLAVAVAFRARLFNIGAEGQLYAGALAAVAVGGLHAGVNDGAGFALSPWLLFPLMMLAAAAAGAVLLLGPALLKSRLGVDEVVTTLLLNFIVLLMVSLMLDGPMKDPAAMGWPQSVEIAIGAATRQAGRAQPAAQRPVVGIGQFCAGLAAAAADHASDSRSARSAPIRVPHVLPAFRCCAPPSSSPLLSGALAGLAGAIEVAGRSTYLTLDMSPGYGYTGIVIAMLAALNPLGVVAAAIFVAGILVGADDMSRAVNVPTYIADVIVAVSLLSMLVASLFAQYRIVFRERLRHAR